MATHLLAETAGHAYAQFSSPSAYDPQHTESDTTSASAPASGQPRTSLSNSLTQAWDTLKKQLGAHGIQLGIRYDGEIFINTSGGLRRGTTYLGNLNLQLTLDAQRLAGWPGATVFLYGLGTHGGHPSTFVGDAQGVSNIEAATKWKIEEGWIQQNLFGNRFSVLIGRYDLNSEFYRLHKEGKYRETKALSGTPKVSCVGDRLLLRF
ncbi:MAG TPA: carbohydrate porin [Candidatus Binatia bacterium]|jgi:carbohydrate-selective porin OprB|nr:carbohydrate porin [Candidatus Binatia bacterium]